MLSYCLKCKKKKKKKNAESIDPKVSSTSNGRTLCYQNVLYVVVKNQNLLKNKKQKDY